MVEAMTKITESNDYIIGFNDGLDVAWNIVQEARMGERDGEFRSLLFAINLESKMINVDG